MNHNLIISLILKKLLPIKESIFLFFIGLISISTWGQIRGHFDEKINLNSFPYTLTNYTTQHGLIQGQITALTRLPDSKTILFSNYNGLFTFNGYSFDVYSPSEQLENKVFKKLWLDKKNKIVYGYRGDDLFSVYPKFFKIGRYKAVSIQNSCIYAIDQKGQISKNGRNLIRISTSYQNEKVFSQIHFINNSYLIAQDQELLLFNSKNKILKPILKEEVQSIVPKNLTEVYVLSKENVWIYNSIHKSFTLLFKSYNSEMYYNDLIEIGSNIVITSNQGLFIYNTKVKQLLHYDENSVLPTNILNFISKDSSDESIFIGTGNKGLLKLQLKTARSGYEKKAFLSKSLTSSVAVNNQGVYSAGGTNLILFDKIKVKKVIPLPVFIASVSQIDSTLYAGSWGDGIVQLSLGGKIIRHITHKKNNFHGVFKDHRGDLWIGYTFGVKKGKSISNCDNFAEKQIKMQVVNCYENSKKELFIGGDDGFRILSPDRKKIKIFNKKRVPEIGEIRSFLEDKNGGIWIGSNGGGLFYLKNNTIISLRSKPNYLLGNEIFTLALDKFEQVIITSNKGIKVVSLQKLNEFKDNKIDYLVPAYIDENKGIYNTEFNGGFQNNYSSFDNVNFYFPTLQGIVYYNSHPIPISNEKVKLKGIWSDDKKISPNHLKFERKTKQITFSFFTTNFVEFENIHYQYKISKDNEFKNWSKPQKETEVRLQNIEPGNYTFMVRSIDSSNKRNPYFIKINFEIEPYFYETWWFIILLIIGVSGLFISIVAYQFYRKKLRLTQLIQMDMMIQETEIKAIHAQMNPHFIFNSLHLINHLITSKKYKKAEELLLNFSKLLRNVLEKSDRLFLTISEEMHFIELYLNIQKSRFNEQLNYTISCDPKLNHLEIPSMIIQPIVENALLHGIAHKMEGIGSISITITKKNNQIHILIQDNGIGRKASAILNSTKSHRSAGYSLIQKKIDLLKSKYKIAVSYTITDIEKKNTTGTLVHLIIDIQ